MSSYFFVNTLKQQKQRDEFNLNDDVYCNCDGVWCKATILKMKEKNKNVLYLVHYHDSSSLFDEYVTKYKLLPISAKTTVFRQKHNGSKQKIKNKNDRDNTILTQFNINDEVYCYRDDVLCKATILNTKQKNGNTLYFVHYHDLSSLFDEYVTKYKLVSS